MVTFPVTANRVRRAAASSTLAVVMARAAESAKWFVFAVKADDHRRASYWRWISRLRQVLHRQLGDALQAGELDAAELVAAKGTDVTSFDPGINPTPDAQQVITMIYDTLIHRDASGNLIPAPSF